MITNSKLIHHPRLPSTNDECKRLAAAGEAEGAVVWADAQTAGRGRGDHRWESEPGGLYCSLLLRPLQPASARFLSLMASVAAAEAVEELAGVKVRLRWPNDLMLGARKVGGILCEISWQGQQPDFAVVGVGVNVNQRSFPAELEPIATSLALKTGREHDISRLIHLFLDHLQREYRAGSLVRPRSEVLQSYRARLSTLGRKVQVDTGTEVVRGKAVDIDEAGHLILETRGGRQVVVTGSIRPRR